MKRSQAISIVSVFIAVMILYYSYGYYVDRTVSEACDDTLSYLQTTGQGILVNETVYVADKIGVPYMGAKDLRREAGPDVSDQTLMDIATIDATTLILFGIDSEKCDLYTNLVKMSQLKAALLLNSMLTGKDLSAYSGEIGSVEGSIVTIDHTKIPEECGFASDNLLLQRQEKDFCIALHVTNYNLAKSLYAQFTQDTDTPSKTYKAMLINCLAQCINSNGCLEGCVAEKAE